MRNQIELGKTMYEYEKIVNPFGLGTSVIAYVESLKETIEILTRTCNSQVDSLQEEINKNNRY